MKKFKNLLKVVSRGSAKSQKGEFIDSGELSENVTIGLKRVFRYLENQSVLPRGLYKEPGFVEEISAIENLINSGKISESYLAAVRSTHSIANSIVNVLSTHDPIIPKDLYDHFMSPLADLDVLMDDLSKKEPLFEVVMQHLRYVVSNASVKTSCGEMASIVGIYILRAAEDDSGIDSHSFEMQSRVKTFEKMLQSYIRGKEDADRFFASANTTNRRSVSLTVPLALPSKSNPNKFAGDSAEFDSGWGHSKPFVTTPPAPSGSGSAHSSPQKTPVNAGTIQERSVKITFANPNAKPTQDALETMLSRYGTVNNVGFKEKLAVALFSTRQEAQACVRDHEEHGTLGDAVKVKYLGGALDPPPSPNASPMKPVNTSLSLQPGEEVTIRHFSALPVPGSTNSTGGQPVEETIKVSSPPRLPAREAANQSLLNTSTISAIENTSGWANASRASPPRGGDKSFTLNLSHVSEFGEPDTTLNHSMSRQAARAPDERDVSRGDALDTSVMSLGGASVNITRSALQPTNGTQNQSQSQSRRNSHTNDANHPNQSLRVQDLSMVSFAADLEDHRGVPTDYSPSGKVSTRATPSKARRYVAESTDSGTADSGGSSPESGAEKEETYPSAPGSAGAVLWPTRTVSPPKPQSRGPKLDDTTRADSLTVSPAGSWKSAQSTKSPELPNPIKKNKKNVHYDTEDESSSEGSGKIMTPNKSSKVNRSSTGGSGSVVDSKASTVMRVFATHTEPPRDRSRSSSSEDIRHSSQLTSVTGDGSSKYNRFSTESLPLNARQSNESYQANTNARSQDTPRSTASGHSTSEQSTTSSVKKRQIRTIHVGSPLNSSENASQFRPRAQQGDDEENYLQEEQSERMMRSRSHSEDLAQRDERAIEIAHVEKKHSRSRSVSKEEPEKIVSRVHDSRSVLHHEDESSHRDRRHSDASAGADHGRMEPHRTTSVPTATISKSNHQSSHQSSFQTENNPEMVRLVQSLQERLLLLEAQVNLSAESETLRKVSQTRAEEQWTAQIIALNIHNQKTFSENAHLQEEMQRLKMEIATTQAELGAAEATKRSLLLNCEGLKDRAQHEALDTVISQKRLIASLEQTLAETRRQSKKLEEELGYMKNKHCTTATSLITWKAKALELTARQMGSTSGSVSSNPPVLEDHRTQKEDLYDRDQSELVRDSLLNHSSSAEQKSAEPDMFDSSYYLSGDSRSGIAENRSRDEGMPQDQTRHTEENEGEQDEEVPQSSDFALNAQRRAADRVTRQYIAKQPVPGKISALLEARGSSLRASSTSQPVFVPNPLYAHLIPGPVAVATSEVPPVQTQPSTQGQRSVQASAPAAPLQTSAEYKNYEQPSRPELTEGEITDHVVPERATTLLPGERASSPHSLRSASAGRSSAHTRQPHLLSHNHDSHHLLSHNHDSHHHVPLKEPAFGGRPSEGNERFAVLMSKRSRSPELPSGRYISPMLPLQHVPLAAEMLEYQNRLQNLSQVSAASRAASSRSARLPASDVGMYSTLTRSYNGESLGGFSSRSLAGDRLGGSLSRSYAPSGTGNSFAIRLGAYNERPSVLSKSMESGLYRNSVHSERPAGAAPPLWAQYKYT